jgi:hypothetical protein
VIDSNTISAIGSFCARQYWTRLWTIQELIVASQITLHCGDWRCSWSQFSLFLETAADRQVMQRKSSNWEMDPRFASITKSVPMKLVRERERKLYAENEQRPLVELCIDFGSSRCEDRRDKVFGLQASTMACCREAVEVNYSASISEISWRLLSHHSCDHAAPIRVAGYAQELH